MLAEQARVVVYDPKVPADEIRRDVIAGARETLVGVDSRLTVAHDVYEAAAGAHALALVTEWDEFKTLDFTKIYAAMHKPAFIFDGRNILDLAKLRELGFRAHGIGK